MKSQRLMALW